MGFKSLAGLSFVCFLSGPLIARDGTLPVILDGMAVPVISAPGTNLKTQLRFNDLVTPPDLDVPCSLSGDSVSSETAVGQVQVGSEVFNIIGTCKDEDGDAYEIVTTKDSRTTNFIGQVSSSSEQIKFKGVVNLMTNNVKKTLKFELKK